MNASKIEPLVRMIRPMFLPAVIRGPSTWDVVPTPGGSWLRTGPAAVAADRLGLIPISPNTPSNDAFSWIRLRK